MGRPSTSAFHVPLALTISLAALETLGFASPPSPDSVAVPASVAPSSTIPDCPAPVPAETTAVVSTSALPSSGAPERIGSRHEIPPGLNCAQASLHAVPRWRDRSSLPRYLLIRLMATPKNHRSPPVLA